MAENNPGSSRIPRHRKTLSIKSNPFRKMKYKTEASAIFFFFALFTITENSNREIFPELGEEGKGRGDGGVNCVMKNVLFIFWSIIHVHLETSV